MCTTPAAAEIRIQAERSLGFEGLYTFTAPSEVEWRIYRGNSKKTLGKAHGRNLTVQLRDSKKAAVKYRVTAHVGKVKGQRNVVVARPNRRFHVDYVSKGNPDLRAYVVLPSTLNQKTRMLVVMHGQSRNADEYCADWARWASANDYAIVCPEMAEGKWPDSRGYNFGNVFSEEDGAGRKYPTSRWAFTLVEGLQDKVRRDLGLTDAAFSMWGHSAGAQFVHRFVLFRPDAPVRLAIAANAGFYTVPDFATRFPYGLKHPDLGFSRGDVLAYSAKPIVLMAGDNDVERVENVRTTPEADRQGMNRKERAHFMYRKIQSINPNTRWAIVEVPGSGHDHRLMSKAAQKLLLRKSAW